MTTTMLRLRKVTSSLLPRNNGYRHATISSLGSKSHPLFFCNRSSGGSGSIHINQLPHGNNRFHSIRCSSSWNWTSGFTAPKKNPTDNDETNGNDNASEQPIEKDEISIRQKEILESCADLYGSMMPLNEKLRGPLSKHSDRGTSLPFVFLVGNHSSGKSSFINHVIGRKVQTAGVAPTDDCFTVITPGPQDTDQDGPALIGDPDIGFAPLRQFGPTLIHHTQLKIRSGLQTPNFMMVDSPGMIDSPASLGGMMASSSSNSSKAAIMDRGYDFPNVVRWFAERADVVLLFFDPDKPGTTGETLSVLLHSLGGMDHKLLIVLNKADQFRKIHDFARAYGSLCWNLSKVIPRKDLPRIYTMCLPTKSVPPSDDSPLPADNRSLADLHQTRDEVIAEVMKAPKRRIDNVITHLNDSVHLLLMHAQVCEDTRNQYSKLSWNDKIQEFGTLSLGAGVTGLGMYMNLPLQFTGGIVGATILGVGGMTWFNSTKLKSMESRLLTPEELSASFQRTHMREVQEADEFMASVWGRIRESLKMSLESSGLSGFPKVGANDTAELRRILEEEIPKLRRKASPKRFGS